VQFTKNNLNKIFSVFILIFWVYLTLHSPVWQYLHLDELHHWNIAADLNVFEIFKLMKYEGHNLLWYLILKPFTVNNLFFPYTLKIINWIFMFFAMVVLLLYSPFKIFSKLAITLTIPFLILFPTFGRCYGLAIFSLFLLAKFYPKKLSHPFLFSLLIVFIANIHLMAAIPAFYLGLIFIYELIKTKKFKQLKFCLAFFLLCVLFLYLQWHNHVVPEYAMQSFDIRLKVFYLRALCTSYAEIKFIWAKTINYGFQLITILIPFVSFWYFKNNKKILFFIFSSWITLIIFFLFFYITMPWHIYLSYIYLIIAYWLYLDDTNNKETLKRDNIFFVFFLLVCFSISNFFKNFDIYLESKNIETYQYVLKSISNIVPEHGVIYSRVSGEKNVETISLKYFLRNKYVLKDFDGDNQLSLKSYIKTWNNDFHNSEVFLYDNFIKKNIQKNSYLILEEDDKIAQKFLNKCETFIISGVYDALYDYNKTYKRKYKYYIFKLN
jgi:hypothetical protein